MKKLLLLVLICATPALAADFDLRIFTGDGHEVHAYRDSSNIEYTYRITRNKVVIVTARDKLYVRGRGEETWVVKKWLTVISITPVDRGDAILR